MQSPTELWRYQGGGEDSTDRIYGASAAEDNSVFLAGRSSGQWNGTSEGGSDFSAAKLDSNGSLLWAWQEGSGGNDRMRAVATVSGGGVVLAGHTDGDWNGASPEGGIDFAAVRLDSAGTVIWRWKRGTDEDDYLRACVQTTDGNVVVAGYSEGSVNGTENDGNFDIVAAKLEVNSGEEIWTYQVGTADSGGIFAKAAAARADGSVVLAGKSFGTFNATLSTTEGYADFAAVAIDENGEELWRWQDGPADGDNEFYACTFLGDGSVVLGGYTNGEWDGPNNGGRDFAMVKLNALGLEEWRWQGGTDLDDQWAGAATAIDGSIVFGGITKGNWAGTRNASVGGIRDFAAMAMSEGGVQLWSYQDGTDVADDLNAVAARPDGSILLAGWTEGTWTTSGDTDDTDDYATVLLDANVLSTPSPEATKSWTLSPTSGPSMTPTSAPQWAPTPAPDSTQWPRSVPPSPTNWTETETPAPASVKSRGKVSSGTSLGLTIGGVLGGALVLMIMGGLIIRVSRRSREGPGSGRRPSTSVASLPSPAAAPRAIIPPPASSAPPAHEASPANGVEPPPPPYKAV